MKTMSSDDEFDIIDRHNVVVDSSSSFTTGLDDSAPSQPPPPPSGNSSNNNNNNNNNHLNFANFSQEANDDDGEDDDHRDDDDYDTDDYSATADEDDEETEYQTEAEDTATEGEFTEPEEDDSSVGTAGSGDSFDSLLLYQVQNNDVSLREMVIDTTSMDRETAEDLARFLEKNTCVTTIRLSCQRLECKEGRERKRHVLSSLLSGVKGNTSIESIEIEDTDISHELAHSLSQLCARRQFLKNIAMIQCRFIGSGLAILFLGMQHSQSIRNVIFQSCDLGHDGSYNLEVIASALPFMKLTALSLVDVNFPTEECLHFLLENVEHAKELKLLDLSQNKLNGRSVALLTRSITAHQNQITRLVLSSCSLDNVCMKELAIGLRGYEPLTNLDVSKNKHISDKGAIQIKDLLKGNSKITKLNVSGCSFPEASLDTLEAALRYNNSFLKTFVSESTGQQIFDVVDAIANLGVGGEEEEEEVEKEVEKKRRGGSSKHRGDDRRRGARGEKQSHSRTPTKSNKSSKIPSPTVDLTLTSGTPPKQDEMRALFRAAAPPPPPPPDLFDRRQGHVPSTPQRNINVPPPLLPGEKTPRSPSTPRQDFAQPQFFEDGVNFDDKSSSHSAQSGTKFSSPQRMNGNVPVPQFNASEEFFPPELGKDFTGSPQYSSSRRSSNSHVPMPQYEFSATSSSQSGTFKPTRQDIRSAKYVAQRQSAVQQSPKSPSIDRVIQQLSPSRRDVARSPKGRSPRGSTSTGGKKKVML